MGFGRLADAWNAALPAPDSFPKARMLDCHPTACCPSPPECSAAYRYETCSQTTLRTRDDAQPGQSRQDPVVQQARLLLSRERRSSC
jgi:hypothetical protein